jgi:hypothetical protein
MSLKYHGKETLIRTGSSFTEFPSGLNRADVTYVCRTTKASSFTASLGAKKALPEFGTYTSQFAATREDRSDGFSYFSAVGYKGNAAASTSTLGAVISNIAMPVQLITTNTQGTQIIENASYPISIISDVVTKTYTISTNSSNTAIGATAPSTLSIRIVSAPSVVTNARVVTKFSITPTTDQTYQTTKTLASYVGGTIDILNLSRQNYGTIDEITITWGYVFSFSNPLQLVRFLKL